MPDKQGFLIPDAARDLALARRVHPKYRPAFDTLNEHDQAAVALYFLPHSSEKDVLEAIRRATEKRYVPFFAALYRFSLQEPAYLCTPLQVGRNRRKL